MCHRGEPHSLLESSLAEYLTHMLKRVNKKKDIPERRRLSLPGTHSPNAEADAHVTRRTLRVSLASVWEAEDESLRAVFMGVFLLFGFFPWPDEWCSV